MKKILLIAFCFYLYSCTKTDQTELNQSSKLKSPLPEKIIGINYFENLGIEHNRWMDFIAHLENFESLHNEDLFEAASSFEPSTLPAYPTTWSQFYSEYAYALNRLNEDPMIAARILVSDNRLPADLVEVVGSLFSILTESQSLEDYESELTQLEKRIDNMFKVKFNEATHQGNGAALLLGACAIARNSGIYWFQAETDEAHLWHTRIAALAEPTPPNGGGTRLARLPRSLRVAGRDVATFVSSNVCVTEIDYGTGQLHGYDFVCAWQQAGNASSQVQ